MELIEHLSFKPTLVEADSNGKKVVEGVFQRADVKNANGRIYKKSLWEKTLSNPEVLKALDERRTLCALDHPASGKTSLADVAAVTTKLWMNENNEICGRAEILGTPKGQILESLLSAGVSVGISSRASGSTTKTPQGEVVNESDFKFETFDFVSNPSTPGAYPKLLSESQEFTNIEENSMTALEKFKLLEQRASTVLGVEPKSLDNNARSLTEDAISSILIEVTKLMNEAPELKDIGEILTEDLKDKRKVMRKPLTEDISVAMGSADQGFMRPPAPQPGPEETNEPGEGWPFNPGDEGILAGINAGVNQWAESYSKSSNLQEKEKEDEDDDDEDDDDDENKKMQMKESLLSSIANQMVKLEETPSNKPLRAFAAAYLLERTKRLNEAEAYGQIVGKLQNRYKQLIESGKVIVEGTDKELKEKYDVSLQIIEELRNRHKNLAAKVYAEAELDKIGLKLDTSARTKLAEAIKKSPTKESIDEAIAMLVPVKGFKKEEPKLTESKDQKVKQLTEDTNYGAAYALQLANKLNYKAKK